MQFQLTSHARENDMAALLSGISMTMAGVAPCQERASQLSDALAKVSQSVDVGVDKVISVLNTYAHGASVARERILEASAQWRASFRALRDVPDESLEDRFDVSPRG